MIYREVIKMKANLDKVNFIEGADPKFGYAVARNKAKAESIIRAMDKTREPSEGIQKYREELDKLNLKYAEKDTDGSVGYVTINTPSGSSRAFRKIIGDGNPGSEYGKALEALKKKYQKDIDEHEAKLKTYTQLLDKEVPAEDFRMLMIDLDIVPKGLNPAGHDGCLEFIKKLPEEEVKSEVNPK